MTVIKATAKNIRLLEHVPASFKLTALALLRAKTGSLEIELPNMAILRFDHGIDGPHAKVRFMDYAVAKRAMAGGDIGFAEAYMDGQWDTPDLTTVLRFFSCNFDAIGQLAVGGVFVRAMNLARHVFNRNSKTGARRNIVAHYDLGNEFYELWLDPSMTYSSAQFVSPNQSLEHGQHAKYAAICSGLSAGPNSNLLEVGCGWGGFAEYAAKERGSNVTCLTISPSQREYAQKRMFEQGLNDRVEIRLEDYRDHEGSYDGVASIEMFEAVGEKYWPSYFAKIASVLKESGHAVLQIITIDDKLFPRYRKRADFIQRYIFPGGMMPSETALKEQVSSAGLRCEAQNLFGEDYARTCAEWRRTFNECWSKIEPMGFDFSFKQMWNFYLSYCEAGFLDGRINVGQFQLSKA